MTIQKSESVRRLIEVADSLDDLTDRILFVGGATLCCLITDEAIVDLRPTNDFYVVVDAVTRGDFYKTLDALHRRGFSESIE